MEKEWDQEGEKEVVVDQVEDEKDVDLPGFRFHPTDEELVGFYLRRKVEKKSLSLDLIKQIDIYKHDPWDLPKASTVGGEKEWYFFCLRGRKYRNSIRPNRVTGSGFWKATGIDKPIYPTTDSNDCIGLKKSLVYYRGSAGKGTKTDWMMHEFRLPSTNYDSTTSLRTQEAEIWTICRIFKRNVSLMKKYTQSVSKKAPADSGSKSSSFESDAGFSGMQPSDHQGYVTGYYYDQKNNYQQQLFGGQGINPTAQAPMASGLMDPTYMAAMNPNVSHEFLKDGNWDELGRIMEFVMDTNTETGCRY